MKGLLKIICLLILLFSIFNSCELDKELYQKPDWLGGSIFETLEKKGNYTSFIELAEKAEYRNIIESDVYTVFAADDDAFKEYFASRGIESVSQLSKRECKSLMAMVSLHKGRSRQQLIYQFINDQWQDSTSEYLSRFFRWNVPAKYYIQKEVVKYNPDYKGQELAILNDHKWIPCISRDLFGDIGGKTDGSDYLYYFPNSTWTGLQWYNAAVIGPEAGCSNGFIYYIDQVVPLMPSIEEYLRSNQDKYGVFYDLMQRFATYSLSYEEGLDYSVYSKGYNNVINIASEDGPQSLGYQATNFYTAYIPTDDVMQEYLNNAFLNGKYPSIDSVPVETIIYLLNGHLAGNWVMPSQIRTEFLNPYGENIDFGLDENVTDAILLSNGAFYELNKVLEPLAFTAAPGPLFKDNNYSTILKAFNVVGVIPTLSYADVPVTVFAADNSKLLEYGIRYNHLREVFEQQNIFGIWEDMEEEDLIDFVYDHIIYKGYDDFSGEGIVYTATGTGVYYNDNTFMAGGNREANEQIGLIDDINSNINGVLYLLDNPIKPPKEDFARYIYGNDDFSEFYSLLDKAGLVDEIPDEDNSSLYYKRLKFLQTYENWTGFLPDNDAIVAAEANNLIPEDIEELKNFLKYHFVANVVINDFSTVSNDYETAFVDSVGVPMELEIQCVPKQMVVTDGSGKEIQINHNTANVFVSDGIAHRIDSVLISK
ncbi:MAG: fasciclin domain-containing protein [Bacteroidales bacterium]|nr:fasciclin domain-containing protein [Bacteroidales bacterium]